MSIKLENLTYTYMPGSPFAATAVHDVSFEIGDGEFFALIGHTGSGKTTIAMHLNALLQPASGRVLVDGQDINAERRGSPRSAPQSGDGVPVPGVSAV